MNDGPSAVRTADATFDEASLLHTREVMGQSGAFPSHVLCKGHNSHVAAVGLRQTHKHLKVLHRQLANRGTNWRLSTAGKVVDTSSHKRHTRCWWSSSQTAESSVTVPPLSLSIRGDKHIFCHRSTFFVDTSNVSVEVTA